MNAIVTEADDLKPDKLLSNSNNLGIISDDITHAFTYATFVFIYAIIGVLGIGTNVINIIIFVQMGLNDTVNITLVSLSISDLWYLITIVWTSILHNPVWTSSEVNFDPVDMQYLSGGWPMFYFSRVSNSITAYLIFTRCLCIVLPLKVKDMVTPKRTIIVIVVIYISMAVSIAPSYFAATYEPIFNPSKNRTILQLVYKDNRGEIDSVTTGLIVVLTILTFIWVIVCTFILVTNLQRKSKWRETTAVGSNWEALSSRNFRVIKMVIILVVIFIIAFLPSMCLAVAMTVKPAFAIGSRYNNIFLITVGVSDITIAINASVNIIVYLKMSSIFRGTFLQFFDKLKCHGRLCVNNRPWQQCA